MQRKPQDTMARWMESMEGQMAIQREGLLALPPDQIALRSGARWEPTDPNGDERNGTLSLTFLQTPLVVQVPDYTVSGTTDRPISPMTQALVTAYLLTADDTPRAGEWVSFRELPDGTFYHQAFNGYTGHALVRVLGDNVDGFRYGAQATGGTVLAGLGDAAYEFRVLPRIWMAVVYWSGDPDDGLPPQARVLFDRAAPHYLIVDGLAITGSQLVRRILAAAKEAC
ncbi:MAG: DUF3786 domain-containing protein [Chloroflexi bacterium]|nr:DUF3786 domain-containing protein [Chloroflexota bacterium]